MARHGRLDVLFNNAGGGHFARIEATTLEQWRYVNALNTNLVATALASLGEEADAFAAAAVAAVPMGRLAEPVEIARPVLFLASDDASFMTGAELVVDGGYTPA